MASSIADGMHKIVNMDRAASSNPKLADLAKDTTHYDSSKNKMTTDWGNKVSNTDHWQTASTEDHIGPSLLEDNHAREKVSQPPRL